MIVIAAVDDKGAMMFNKRRQSQDKVLRENMVAMTQNSRLWMNTYSKKQFDSMNVENIMVDEQFLDKAFAGEYCFVENLPIQPYLNKIEQIVLYKWNRMYPGDMLFDVELSDVSWKLISVSEFQGYSHERITREIWERC